MPNYPCPPLGFQFTDENFWEALPFYLSFVIYEGAWGHSLRDASDACLTSDAFLDCNINGGADRTIAFNVFPLPWTVTKNVHGENIFNGIFIETQLPKGATT